MTAPKTAPDDDLRMSSKEFDRIMGQALRAKPEDGKKAKTSGKSKKARKKPAARK